MTTRNRRARPAEERSITIALDGPSALTLYRDRASLVARSQGTYDDEEEEDVSDLEWLSDEDVAAMLAAESAFGHRAYASEVEDEGVTQALPKLRRTHARSLSQCASDSRDLKLVAYDELGICPPSNDMQLYILVPNAKAKRHVRNVCQRACSCEVPRGSFMRLGDQVLVPSPELTLILLSRHLGLVELIAVGMELCGRYRMVGGSSSSLLRSSDTIYNQDPLTSPQKIARLLERMKDFPGVQKARRACKYMEAGSASPMETYLYLLLCLPYSLGGYGLERPMLNAKRKVNTHAEAFTLSRTLVPDLYWPSARLDMEYDSDEFHSDPESLRKGARRTLALRAMNVDVISMTYDVVIDAEAFHAAARLAAKKLHKRMSTPGKSFEAKRDVLRATLLGV